MRVKVRVRVRVTVTVTVTVKVDLGGPILLYSIRGFESIRKKCPWVFDCTKVANYITNC